MGASAKSIIQMGMEAVYAQGGALPAAVPALHIIPNSEFKAILKKEYDKPNEQRGSYDMYFQNLQPLTKVVDWTLKGQYYPDTVGPYLWLMAMNNNPGIVNTAIAAPNPAYNTWTFLPADAGTIGGTTENLQTVTIEEFDGTTTWQYPNAFATKLEIDVDAAKNMTYTLTGMASDQVVLAALTTGLTQPTDLPHNGISAQFSIDPVGSPMGTTAYADVMTAKITIELKTKPIWTAINSSQFSRFYRGKRLVSFDLDIDFPNTVEYGHFRSADYRYLQMVLNGALFGAGANKGYKTTLNVPVRYETFERDKTKEHTTAKVKCLNYYDAGLGYSHKLIAQVSSAASALTNY